MSIEQRLSEKLRELFPEQTSDKHPRVLPKSCKRTTRSNKSENWSWEWGSPMSDDFIICNVPMTDVVKAEKVGIRGAKGFMGWEIYIIR